MPAGTGTLTAAKNVLPEPRSGAAAVNMPFAYLAVPQVWREESRWTYEFGGMVELEAPLKVSLELVKLTSAWALENFGLKAALIQTTSPYGTDWLLKWVEKQTFLAQGVEVGGGGGGVEVVVEGGGGGGRGRR